MKIFAEQEISYDDSVILTTSGKYSMNVATQILEQLEGTHNCEIENDHWKRDDYGELVEVGIPIRFESIVFRLMCSYDSIFISRIAGNKAKFYGICEIIQKMDFKISN